MYNQRNYFNTRVTVMRGSKANPNPKSQIQMFQTLWMNRMRLLWLSLTTLVQDMCGPTRLEKQYFLFSAGQNSFLTESQAIQANSWQ